MSSSRSRPRRSAPSSPRTGSPSNHSAFGGDSSRGYGGYHYNDNPGSRFSGQGANRNALEPPLRNETYIKLMYKDVNIPAWITDNPKNFLTEFASKDPGTTLSFKYKAGTVNKLWLWRSTITLELNPPIVGNGDSPTREDSENLAVLSVVYQVVQRGLLDDQGKINNSLFPQTIPQEIERTLSDNETKVDYVCARQFIGYYTQRFEFGREDIEYSPAAGSDARNGNAWMAVMSICGRQLGLGLGPTKEQAQRACFVHVAVFLEACDPSIWASFVETLKKGRDRGMTPPIHCSMSETLEDEIYELHTETKKSTLYKNALRLRPSLTHPWRPNSPQTIPGTQPHLRRLRELPPLGEKDRVLKARREKYLTDPAMKSMRDSRAALPITAHAQELLDHIRDNDVTICIASTGSGKTTQIPQLILEDFVDRGEGSICNIICTQPYRLAATSVAQRVAKERGEQLGASIGYQVRFGCQLPKERGSITFCTTGIFLERMQSALDVSSAPAQQRFLDDATHIVVDEAHERDVDTDLLFVVLKRLLTDRKAGGKPIKVVLMSANIDPTLLQQYFPDDKGQPSKVIDVPGRAFPVKKHFLDDLAPQLASIPGAAEAFAQYSVARFIHNELGPGAPRLCQTSPPHSTIIPSASRSCGGHSALSHGGRDSSEELEFPAPLVALTITQVLRNFDDGHVLTFLPGWDEIQCVHRYLTDPASNLGVDFDDSTKWSIRSLHSTISVAEQEGIFEPPPKGVRRVILATNIAETSVTIPDVLYVVDTARTKEQRFDPKRHNSSLVSTWIGSWNLNQRAGQAGRHGPGEYFGIISQKRASELRPYQTVGMKRVDLSNVVMRAKALNFPGTFIEDILSETIEPPAMERVVAAMKNLSAVGALDAQKNLTPLGKVLLRLPVEVQVGRLLLLGAFFKCLDSALTLAAILTNQDPFMAPRRLERGASAIKTPSNFHSDVLAVLSAYDTCEWGAISASLSCPNNPMSESTFSMIRKIKDHLLQSLYRAGVIDVLIGTKLQTWRRETTVPPELNINGNSTPLLIALISAGSQPNFAVRAGYNMHRTFQDEEVFIHPSSVNHRKKEMLPPDNAPLWEKQVIAFAEKRKDISVVAKHPREFIVTTTQLDPMSYLLFGANNTQVAKRGLECDEWLPIIGKQTTLDQILRLKESMDLCFLRVCEGITIANRHRDQLAIISPREEQSDDDETRQVHERDCPLSSTESMEFEDLTRNLVYIMNQYNEEGMGVGSHPATSSGPATPVESPYSGTSRFRGSSNEGLRRTGSRPQSSKSRTSSISEGHQSPEDDGESRKKVDWYDEALSQSSAANPTSRPLKPRTSDPSTSAPGKSVPTSNGSETRKDNSFEALPPPQSEDTRPPQLPEETRWRGKAKTLLSLILSRRPP